MFLRLGASDDKVGLTSVPARGHEINGNSNKSQRIPETDETGSCLLVWMQSFNHTARSAFQMCECFVTLFF